MKRTAFYKNCLDQLRNRATWTPAWIPILDEYVFKMTQAEKMIKELEEEPVFNNSKWRSYMDITKSTNALADRLQLNPLSMKDKEKKTPVKKVKKFEVK